MKTKSKINTKKQLELAAEQLAQLLIQQVQAKKLNIEIKKKYATTNK